MASLQVAGFEVTPALLYRTSAALFAVLIPGHVIMGLTKVHPALSKLATASATYRTKANGQMKLLRDERAGLRGAQVAWNAWNFFAGAIALLTYQISNTPAATRTREERAILVLSAIANWLSSAGYFGVGELGASVLLFVAPATALAALVLEGGIETLTKW